MDRRLAGVGQTGTWRRQPPTDRTYLRFCRVPEMGGERVAVLDSGRPVARRPLGVREPCEVGGLCRPVSTLGVDSLGVDVPSVSLAGLASHLPATSSRGGVPSNSRMSHTKLHRATDHAALDRAIKPRRTPFARSTQLLPGGAPRRGGGAERSEAEGTSGLGRQCSRDQSTPSVIARSTHAVPQSRARVTPLTPPCAGSSSALPRPA